MSTVERPGSTSTTGAALSVRRQGTAVRVVAGEELDGDAIERLEAMLIDLIDGQGNLAVEVVLSEVAVVDLPLLDVLVGAEQRLASRGGSLIVATRAGCWTSRR